MTHLLLSFDTYISLIENETSLHLDTNNGSNSSLNMEQMLIHSIKRGNVSG